MTLWTSSGRLTSVDVSTLANVSTSVNRWRRISWLPKQTPRWSSSTAACAARRCSAAPLADAEAAELAKVFAALADPVRLRLLSLVAAGGEVCSCDLEDPVGQVAADDQPSHQGARRRRPAHRREARALDDVAGRARAPRRPPGRALVAAARPPMRPDLPRRFVAEFVGTAMLVAVVVGSGIAAERLSPGNVGLQLLENSARPRPG